MGIIGDVTGAVSSGFDDLTSAAGSAIDAAGSGLSTAGHAIGSVASSAGDTIAKGATGAYDFLIGDDLHTLTDSNAPLWQRGLAVASIASNFVAPEVKGLGLAGKAALKVGEHALEHGAVEIGTHAAAKLATDAATHAAVDTGEHVAGRVATRGAEDTIEHSATRGTKRTLDDAAAHAADDAGETAAKRSKKVLSDAELTGKPNATYNLDGYTFKTDGLGRTSKVEADLRLGEGAARSSAEKKLQGLAGGKWRLATDDGGHMVGHQFEGPTSPLNLLAQNSNLNRGQWLQMEKGWAKALKEGKEVSVEIKPEYKGDSLRPERFRVKATIDGETSTRFFRNQSGG
jgi:hypothetical protein